MKEAVKAVLSRVAPEAYQRLVSRRARARNQRLEVEWGCAALTERYIGRWGAVVRSGPFAGLEFSPRTFRRHIVPRLVGSYELELHESLERLFANDYRAAIDVGCAEGYYAVGMARRLPRTTVHAFDTDAWARRTVRDMAARNGVTNLVVHAACDPDWLRANLAPDTLIVSDCEGYEDVLFDPAEVPGLRGADLLIELHEDQSPGVTARLVSRFAATHAATLVGTTPRDPDGYPALAEFADDERRLGVADIRPENQEWLVLERKPKE